MKLKLFLILLVCQLIASLPSFAIEKDVSAYTQSRESLVSMTPQIALEFLKEGNNRFVSGKMKNRDFIQQAKLTKKAQFPYAFILSCMDSRGSPEIIFDQGIGDIFVARVAGNVVNDDQLGSMEYATQVMGSHIIVVMGHTACGAVKGACEKVKLGNLTQLLDKINPAVVAVQKEYYNFDCKTNETVDAIAKQNVLNMIEEIKRRSPLIQQSIQKGEVEIVGAIHDLKSGKVTFF